MLLLGQNHAEIYIIGDKAVNDFIFLRLDQNSFSEQIKVYSIDASLTPSMHKNTEPYCRSGTISSTGEHPIS
jgi:hypothetical protein